MENPLLNIKAVDMRASLKRIAVPAELIKPRECSHNVEIRFLQDENLGPLIRAILVDIAELKKLEKKLIGEIQALQRGKEYEAE